MKTWYLNWKVKINSENSSHIAFSLKKELALPDFSVKQNYATSNVRYLGLTLDFRLTWDEHIKKMTIVKLST